MTIPGLLIEYLISGATALIWLAPLLKSYGVDPLQANLLPLLAIALYVVGMVIDFLAFWLVKPLKPIIYRWAWSKIGDTSPRTKNNSVEREIQFALYAPEIAKEVAMRSSRDRIARGALVNALIAFLLEQVFGAYPTTLPISVWIPAIILFIAMWFVFQRLSYWYEINAALEVQRKINKQD
jgi:hypothetical protein